MATFQEMGLPESLIHTLKGMQFNKPTPIQEQAIPPALEGRDIIGSAQTGTGKTGAFGIPLVVNLLSNPSGSALVITPTRELATQVITQLKSMLGHQSKTKSVLLIGGNSMFKQLNQLKSQPKLIVGTPGRINDHLKRGSLNLRSTNFLVLDETDQMLDMGFKVQIEKIIKRMNSEHQTLLFSATFPENIIQIAKKYLKDPLRASVSDSSKPLAKIKQDALIVDKGKKYAHLVNELKNREGSILIFLKTKFSTQKMADKLTKAGHSARAIHGDLKQNKRHHVIESFRDKKYRILVATDVAARGLDIPHIQHVINYDLPQCAEDYIHRIGRTARADAEGSALIFVTHSEENKWRMIKRSLSGQKSTGKEKPKRPSRSKKKARGKNQVRNQRNKSAKPSHGRSRNKQKRSR